MKSTVVFIHGLFGSEKDWQPVIQGMTREGATDILALTLPGHGPRPQTLKDYSIESLAQWTLARVNEMGACHFVGYSLGGRILLQLFAEHPDIFKSLILISTEKKAQSEARLVQDQNWCEQLAQLKPQEFFSRWYGQELFSSLANQPDLLASMIRERAAHENPCFEAVLRDSSPAQNKSMWPLIKNISQALWIVGSEDVKYKVMAQTVVAENPRIEIKCVEKAGHAVHLEKPHELIKILKNYLRDSS